MAIGIDLLLFIGSCLVLVFSGVLLVKTLTIISSALRLSGFVVSFVLMAISTSLPELFVGITSAIQKNSALSLGTVIGSNIANLTLVGGMMIIFARGFKSDKESRKSSWFMLLLAALPMMLMFIGHQLSRIDGIILLLVFAGYMIFLLSRKRDHHFKDKVRAPKALLAMLIFIASLFLLYYSAKFAVKYASSIAFSLMLPPIIIGLFFIALGTSLPELVFGTIAARQKKPDIALGNLIGSVIANSLLILGITAIITPITANFFLYLTSAVFMMAVIFLFVVFLNTDRELSWREGMALVIFYVLFLIVELNIPRFLT